MTARLFLVAAAMLIGACAKPEGETPNVVSVEPAEATVDAPARPEALESEPPLMTQVNDRAPYAGEWAAERSHCSDDRKKWTIEPHRMAIVPSMRFCAFENIYVNQAAAEGETSWSAGATCLAEGRESHDFLFFRVTDDMKQMRVTFNDSRSVQLYRCLAS